MKLTVPGKQGRTGRAALMYLGIVAGAAAVAIALSSFQVQLGLAKPTPGGVDLVRALVEVEATLETDADYDEFSTALRVAQVLQRAYVVRNSADLELEPITTEAVDRYVALREAWQLDIEGAWEADLVGDPTYWRGAHTGLDVPDGVLTADDVIAAARTQAAALLADALSRVDD